MRLALFGGTFDPIHRGHLAIAGAAAEIFTLDTVLFAPTGRQPLKADGAIASFADRLAMAKLACASRPDFSVTDLDAPHPDGTPNYTVDLLAKLAEQYPEAKLFHIVGADSFLNVARWRDPDRLFQLAEWIVVSRPGFTLRPEALSAGQRARVHRLDSVHEDISATGLRARLKAGDPCLDLIPGAVVAYIREHHLYR